MKNLSPLQHFMTLKKNIGKHNKDVPTEMG